MFLKLFSLAIRRSKIKTEPTSVPYSILTTAILLNPIFFLHTTINVKSPFLSLSINLRLILSDIPKKLNNEAVVA